MRSGTSGVDFETNVDFKRLKADRLRKTKASMKDHGLGALLCYDFDNIRYITGTHLGEWGRSRMIRHCLLIEGDEHPYAFDPAAPSKRKRVDWIPPDHILPAINSMKGTVPAEVGMVEEEADEIIKLLKKHDVADKPIGMDIGEVALVGELLRKGINVVDGQAAMVDARMIKTDDEIQLLKTAAAMVDAAYYDIAKALRPGSLESDLVAIANYSLYKMGSEWVEFVNSISGERGNPHSHTFSNRMIRPGELVYLDLGHAYNGYRTCYYRTFSCGKPNKAQEAAYEKALSWLRASIAAVKPGNTTADVAASWPAAPEYGLKDEREALLLQFGHGLGLGNWEKPIISRYFSLNHPFKLQEGMVFALETWCPASDGSGSARIEEEVVVTKDGCEVITKFPSDEITSCGLPGCKFL